jgi:hypothetical protein
MFKQFAVAVAALFIATAAAEAQCPEVGRPAKAFAISEGFPIDPNVHEVAAGGDLNLGRCPNVPGEGWITRRPDFVVVYRTRNGGRSAFNLTFRIESVADTVILINDPTGRWYFNDDGGRRLNARISFQNALPGRYDIWVGTYTNRLSRARLVVTERE